MSEAYRIKAENDRLRSILADIGMVLGAPPDFNEDKLAYEIETLVLDNIRMSKYLHAAVNEIRKLKGLPPLPDEPAPAAKQEPSRIKIAR